MKKILIIILFITYLGCSTTDKLNKMIDISQKESVRNSPFETAKEMTAELKRQKEYRKKYLNDLYEIIKSNPNDTIIIKEIYDFICLDCPADYVKIFVDCKLFFFKRDNKKGTYIKSIESLTDNFQDSTGFFYSDISELKTEIKKGNSWNGSPENYGETDVLDGSHTLYTVYYPEGKVLSMYMRHWILKELRNNE